MSNLLQGIFSIFGTQGSSSFFCGIFGYGLVLLKNLFGIIFNIILSLLWMIIKFVLGIMEVFEYIIKPIPQPTPIYTRKSGKRSQNEAKMQRMANAKPKIRSMPSPSALRFPLLQPNRRRKKAKISYKHPPTNPIKTERRK